MFPGALPIEFSIPSQIIELIKKLVDQINTTPLEIKDQSYRQVKEIMKDGFKENDLITLDDFNNINIRMEDLTKLNYGVDIVEYILPSAISKSITPHIPESIIKYHPRIILQIIKNSRNLAPHRDHDRISSLMLPLITDQAETIWYDPTDQFVTWDSVRLADPTKIRETSRMQLQENTWYVFDHYTYHSVENFNHTGRHRASLCIEFNTISAEELYNLFNTSMGIMQ